MRFAYYEKEKFGRGTYLVSHVRGGACLGLLWFLVSSCFE